MQCIYLDEDTCMAQPSARKAFYKPSESEIKELCKTDKFSECIRIHMYERFLERGSEE